MTIDGLPLHPLVVHATVVCLPVAAVVAWSYLVPRWRERLRWPLGLLGVAAAVLVWLAAWSGGSLKDTRFAAVTGSLAAAIQHHEDLAGKLEFVTYVYAGLAVITCLLHGRAEAPRWLHPTAYTLTALAAVAMAVYVVLTGEAGARAVWG